MDVEGGARAEDSRINFSTACQFKKTLCISKNLKECQEGCTVCSISFQDINRDNNKDIFSYISVHETKLFEYVKLKVCPHFVHL